jgi:hypothetical protein
MIVFLYSSLSAFQLTRSQSYKPGSILKDTRDIDSIVKTDHLKLTHALKLMKGFNNGAYNFLSVNIENRVNEFHIKQQNKYRNRNKMISFKRIRNDI